MSRSRIIIDTDPGVDDAAAIWLALASPEIEVLGISVVAGNVGLDASVTNALKVVALAGRDKIGVYAGAAQPLIREQVLGKYAHIGAFPDALVPPTDLQPQNQSAVSFIAQTARAAARAKEKITICALGPLTNLALALRLHPEVAQGIDRIIAMGGAFAEMGHRTPWSEYNVHADPHAAQIVWNSGVPLVLAPLDVTMQALFAQDDLSALEAHGHAPGSALAALLRCYDRGDLARYGREGGPIHDAMTIAYLINPKLFSGRDMAVGVTTCGPTAGQTWADFHARSSLPAQALVLNHVDEAAYRLLLTSRIAALEAGSNSHPEPTEITP